MVEGYLNLKLKPQALTPGLESATPMPDFFPLKGFHVYMSIQKQWRVFIWCVRVSVRPCVRACVRAPAKPADHEVVRRRRRQWKFIDFEVSIRNLPLEAFLRSKFNKKYQIGKLRVSGIQFRRN